MEAGALKRLMGHLNYAAHTMDPKGNDEKQLKQEEARACLKAWEVLEPAEKKEFLLKFDAAGGTKGKDSLKYCLEYVHKVSTEKTVKVTLTEDFHTRPHYLYCYTICTVDGRWRTSYRGGIYHMHSRCILQRRRHKMENLLQRRWRTSYRGGGIRWMDADY